ncbi:hypothetical protein ABIE66_001997 [Peribacillus sp. B2I2]|uniref:BhlA/UviB family holin-like peptide n=1 Tax=Peribacillus sp. B2I2 TaxID=3156468 RepID=UPI003511D5AB
MIEILMVAVNTIDLTGAGQMLIDNGIFAVLFGWLFWDTRKETKNREERLMNHIDKQGEALDRITDTMEKMDVRLTHIEGKVNSKK